MKQFREREQKIVATCILQKDNKVLLLRGSQLNDVQADIADTGYFDVPRFEINFGKNPEHLIKEQFIKYFGHSVVAFDVIDVQQNIFDENTTQIFEIIYILKCENLSLCSQQYGIFFFADVSELSAYMLTDQYEYIIKYL